MKENSFASSKIPEYASPIGTAVKRYFPSYSSVSPHRAYNPVRRDTCKLSVETQFRSNPIAEQGEGVQKTGSVSLKVNA